MKYIGIFCIFCSGVRQATDVEGGGVDARKKADGVGGMRANSNDKIPRGNISARELEETEVI